MPNRQQTPTGLTLMDLIARYPRSTAWLFCAGSAGILVKVWVR